VVSEEMLFENVNGRTDAGRTDADGDGRTLDDGRSVITIAHPEHKLR